MEGGGGKNEDGKGMGEKKEFEEGKELGREKIGKEEGN